MIPVTDAGDPRIDVFLGLRDHHARQLREQPGGDMAGVFICEGDLVIERALVHGLELRSVLVGARRTKPLPSIIDDTSVFAASDDVLAEVTGRPELRDPLACFVRPTMPDPHALVAENRTFAVLEGINNPNNLGVIMRNAAGLGVEAVLLDPTCGDPLYRRAIRASMGQVFALPHARIGHLPEALGPLHDAGVTTVALTPAGGTHLRDIERPDKVALLLGAEGPGLTDATLAAVNVRTAIAMHNNVDSLNVAAAAAIAFHHFDRS
jgi:tRNA G18 (ribose-2'-O)-methylase SpoU